MAFPLWLAAVFTAFVVTDALPFSCSQNVSAGAFCQVEGRLSITMNLMYYFNQTTSTCQTFTYYGCQGTQNSFSTKAQCEEACIVENDESDGLTKTVKSGGKFSDYSCDGEWLQYSKSCVKVIGSKRTWQEAREFCSSRGGDLVALTNREYFRFVRDLLSEKQRYWIGLNDRMRDGTFVWLDSGKEAERFKKWIRSPINEDGEEYCVEMAQGKAGWYNDKYCNTARPFVCQKDAHKKLSARELKRLERKRKQQARKGKGGKGKGKKGKGVKGESEKGNAKKGQGKKENGRKGKAEKGTGEKGNEEKANGKRGKGRRGNGRKGKNAKGEVTETRIIKGNIRRNGGRGKRGRKVSD